MNKSRNLTTDINKATTIDVSGNSNGVISNIDNIDIDNIGSNNSIQAPQAKMPTPTEKGGDRE